MRAFLRLLAALLVVAVLLVVVMIAAWELTFDEDVMLGALLLAVVALGLLRVLDARRIADLEARLDARSREPAPPLPEPSSLATEAGDPPVPASRARRSPAPRRLARRRQRPPRAPFSWDALPPEAKRAWDFATGGNLLARVGLVVLFVGLGLLIRYAVDQGVISIEVRLAFAAVVGLALVAIGWRLRAGTPGFGLTLQGGGVAVLYLTVYAAYALYGLVPSLVAIALMALVAVACGALAVVQNAPGLAVLGVAGGFAAPVLAGTSDGSHLLLLGYYALLNLGVLGVAWVKGWRSVAVVGFVSTFVTGGLWGGLQYRPALYASVQPFVLLNFAVYLALAVRFAMRSARAATPERALAVDGGLVFGLPAATFALQAGLVEGVVPYGRAWSAVVLAVIYLVGARVLRQRDGLRLLADAFLAIGLAFGTLALPLAFERVVVGAMWVLEGAGLVWVGSRQRKGWMRLGGLALQSIAALVLFTEGVLAPSTRFSPETLTGWIVAIGLGLSAYVLRTRPVDSTPDGETPPPASRWRWTGWEPVAARLLLGFALFWWTVTAGVHALDLASDDYELAAMLGAAAASALLFLGVGQALRWRGLAAASFGLAFAAWLLWVGAFLADADPVAYGRGPAWLAVFVVAGLALWAERTHPLRRSAFVATVWLAAAVVAWALGVRVGGATEGAWALAAVGAVLVVALALAGRIPDRWVAPRARRMTAVGLVSAVTVWTVVSWASPGEATPFATWPLLNPVDVVVIAALLVLVATRGSAEVAAQGLLAVLIGGLGLGSLTATVARGAHAVNAAPWTVDGLFTSSTAQAALAVAWTILALGLAVVAVRRESRGLWFFGAGVLGLVVAKLFIVDLSQAEALVRIGAFLVVGTLVLLIGYRAPLPPARGGSASSDALGAAPMPSEEPLR